MLATKVFGPMTEWPNDGGLSARHIRDACEASLRRLQTDHIDLYQMHHVDRNAPWDEVWQAMETLVDQGKVIYVGSSNFAGWHIAQANEAAAKRNFLGLVSEQSLYNLASRTVELEVLPACRGYGLGVIPWSPLAGGMLGGMNGSSDTARRKSLNPRYEAMRPQLEKWEKLCAELGEEPAAVALAWLLAAPRGDRADHRPAHARAARRRFAARDRDQARRRRAEDDQRDLPRARARHRRRTPGEVNPSSARSRSLRCRARWHVRQRSRARRPRSVTLLVVRLVVVLEEFGRAAVDAGAVALAHDPPLPSRRVTVAA